MKVPARKNRLFSGVAPGLETEIGIPPAITPGPGRSVHRAPLVLPNGVPGGPPPEPGPPGQLVGAVGGVLVQGVGAALQVEWRAKAQGPGVRWGKGSPLKSPARGICFKSATPPCQHAAGPRDPFFVPSLWGFGTGSQ
ncbi:MAG: hypothetical protein CM15mP84_00010 [Cellvibrionales bacterium]|nr:MAG: hypothetical protein CM15mP84_00010 [Cellvibrionales bacterium]